MKTILLIFFLIIIAVVLVFAILEYSALRSPDIKVPKGASFEEKMTAIGKWFDVLEKQKRFNGTMLFAQNGKAIFQRNIGHTDVTRTRKISNKTSFNLASVTKQFTAFAILLLVKDDKLDRGDSIAKYLPELVSYKKITINHLLYHTGGVPNYVTLSKKEMSEDEIFTASLLISWLNREDSAPHFLPGEKEQYSNSSYVLLAEIVARVSKMSFSEFMSNRVFEPLAMHETAVVTKMINKVHLADRAYGFRKKYLYFGPDRVYDLNHLDGAVGDGNIYSSAGDLLKWDTALRSGALLPLDFYEQAYIPARLNNGKISELNFWGIKTQSGLGWAVEKIPIVYSYGSWQGFSNLYRRDLEKNTVLIILSNEGIFFRTVFMADKLIEVVDEL